MFIHRSLTEASGTSDAIKRITQFNIASGLSINLGNINETDVYQCEVAPNKSDILKVKD